MTTRAFAETFKPIVEPVQQGKEMDLYCFEPAFESAQGATSSYRGREVIMLTSNNYLGLADHPEIKQAMKAAIDRFGSGTCGARLHNGTTVLHKQLEERLAEFLGTESTLIFNAGFLANLGTLSALANDGTVLITDQLNHMSIVDGCNLAEGKVRIFSHNDMSKLRYILERCGENEKKLIVVDGVFSMEGDFAPLDQITRLAEEFDALVMVDEAHGLGVLGATGRGTAEHFGVAVDITMGTFSKSLAGVGGFIAASRDLCEYVRHTSHAYIFNASIPPATVAGVTKALELMQRESWRREKLWRNTIRFRSGLIRMGFEVAGSVTPIVPIFVGDDLKTMTMSRELLRDGVYIASAIFPAVPRNASRFRATITASLEEHHIDRALEIIESAARRHGLIH